MNSVEVNVFWFRRDLRLEDHKGLTKAMKSGLPVLPIFIFDTSILDKLEDRTDHRVTFIHDTLRALNDRIMSLGSVLHSYYGDPKQVWVEILKNYNVKNVFCNKDYEPYAKNRDREIKELCTERETGFNSYKDHVIFEEVEVVKKDGFPYTVFTPYKRVWLSKLDEKVDFVSYQVDNWDGFYKTSPRDIITLEAMGFARSEKNAPRLGVDQSVVSNYDKTRDFPWIQNGTSKQGVHLRFGTISIRQLARTAIKLNDTYLNELIWRDFYSQILANFPHVAKGCFRKKYEYVEWRHDEADFEKWCNGMTGYPLVDAGMRELNVTGHMHNRVRMVVSSFLTKHLLIDYKWGEAYFAEKLFDFDLASNNGGWQWAAGCGTDAAPYFRIFNPTTQLQKFDKKLKYSKKWVSEFGTFGYVQPMVDHKAARQRCLETYKRALDRS